MGRERKRAASAHAQLRKKKREKRSLREGAVDAAEATSAGRVSSAEAATTSRAGAAEEVAGGAIKRMGPVLRYSLSISTGRNSQEVMIYLCFLENVAQKCFLSLPVIFRFPRLQPFCKKCDVMM